MDTLALDHDLWDFTVDAYGNWATIGDATPAQDSTGPAMRLAQDVATRCQAWLGEVYYDKTQGIAFEGILGQAPNLAFVQNAFNTEALKVPGCRTALSDLRFEAGTVRTITGSITVSDVNGNVATVQL